MSARPSPAIFHAADYGGAYSGNFVASLRALQGPCRSMGLRLALAFSDFPLRRPWLESLRDAGIGVHLLQRGGPLAVRARALARIAASENAALVHTHFTRWDLPAGILGGLTGTPVVWHLHSPFPPLRAPGFLVKTAIKLRVFGRWTRVVSVSEAILRDAIRRGFPARHASYVPNAVDLAHATRASAGRAELRRSLALSPATQVALAFGWDPARKGVDLALSAVDVLARAGRDVALVLVGGEALQAFATERLGGARPGWLRLLPPREQVGDLYAAADVFLSPSRAEGFPYALGEALANGLVSVTSDIPGVEWARGLDAAAFFPCGDAGALAATLAEALDRGPERRAAAADEARAFAAAHLSLGAWAERVVAVYRDALERS